MPLDFCAIDFETANEFRGSPCAVGLAKVIDGRVVESRKLLMRPPEDCDWFDDFNIELHGITPAMVRHEPRFAARLPEIVSFADGLPLAAHNAAFDLGVIRDACDASATAWPSAEYACTLVTGRVTYPDLLSYSLPFVAHAAGVPLDAHHDPEADALAAAGIMLDIAARHGAATLDAVLDATHCVWGELSPDVWQGCTHRWAGEGFAPPAANPDADPAHPFYGREIVFTGALASIVRARAWELVAECGGQPAENVTKRTDILVVGYQDSRKLRPGETLSGKRRKAQELRAAGQRIELLTEPDFVQQIKL